MRIIFAIFCCTLSGIAFADEAAGIGEIDGERIIIAPDFTWRFDDSGGERCTNIDSGAAVCALPSVWSPVPGAVETFPRWFRQGTDLRAKLTVLTGIFGETIASDDVFRVINADRNKDSGYGLKPDETDALLVGMTPNSLVSVIGSSETRAYSFAYMQDGRVVLATTVEQNSHLYSETHRKAHAAFVRAIQVEVPK